jgi:hypothetical protein
VQGPQTVPPLRLPGQEPVASQVHQHAEALGNPFEQDRASSSGDGVSISLDTPSQAAPDRRSIAHRMHLGFHAALNFVREGTCQGAMRIPAVVGVALVIKGLVDVTDDPFLALGVLGTIDIATTVGNHWYFTRRLSRGGDMGPELGDAEDVRPSGDSMTFRAVKVLAFAMPFVAIPVVLGAGGYADAHSMSDERVWNLTSAGPECALKFGVTGGPWAYGGHLALTHVVQPLLVGKVARVFRQLVQSVSRSPITSGCVVGYEFPNGSFERLDDHDQARLNALRDAPYCVSSFVLLYCCSMFATGLSESIDGALCATMVELGLDLNSPVWGTVNEAFDGAFPVLSGLLFSSFPEWFGARPQTAHLIRCRVDRQPSILDGWQGFADDFKRHASVRMITGAAGADFPSVLAGLADLSGVKWPGHLVRAVGSGLNGVVCGARARFLAYAINPSETARPGGLTAIATKGWRKSVSSLSDTTPEEKPMTPREKKIAKKIRAWTPPRRPVTSSTPTSRESANSSPGNDPV